MVRIVVVLVAYFISLISTAQNNEKMEDTLTIKPSFQVNVHINNINSDQGKVHFALYDSKENFLNKKYVEEKKVLIKNGVAEVTFSKLSPDTYAIICYHDANNNGRMDFEDNGMPMEDYGATNNVMNFGPPQFSDAKFELIDKDLTFEIKF